MRRYGPVAEDWQEKDVPCAACGTLLAVGDYVALVPIGPGADRDARAKAAAGQLYDSVTVVLHYVCATGVTEPPDEVKVPV